ncbi:hypothetical protein GH714_006090 [Hevea brasiliensis]|uniref:Uncharacterized protein n=1 Tax=Hevea brasiliensis TaxID=3981 RepID=A0A6A6NFT9_HEVBR|nr:hypothetical protein GH714_006090 [Hevea brasiliensis]
MKKAEEDQLEDMVDGSEDIQLHKSEAVEMMRVAIWCLHSDYTRRPSMSVVVKVLEGTVDVEADLDYAIHNPIAMAAIRREVELGTTTPVLPSFLSGPRVSSCTSTPYEGTVMGDVDESLFGFDGMKTDGTPTRFQDGEGGKRMNSRSHRQW